MCKILDINQGFLSTWGDLLSFPVPGGTEKIAGLWFAWEYQYPGWHHEYAKSIKIPLRMVKSVAYEKLLNSWSYNTLSLSQSFFIWYFNWEGHMLWWEGSPMKALSSLCCVWDTHMTESILSWIKFYKISIKVGFFQTVTFHFFFFWDCLPNCKLRW